MNHREWLIERVLLGERDRSELTEEEVKRLEVLKLENQRILSAFPPKKVAGEVARRVRRDPKPKSGPRPFLWVPAMAAACVLFLFIPSREPDEGEVAEEVRIKGQTLLVHRQSAQGAERLRDGDWARKGDRLQLGFRLDESKYVILLSVDGAGTLSFHIPGDRNARSPRMGVGLETTPFSYELDDAPSFERFFLFTARVPFAVADVVSIAKTWPKQEHSQILKEFYDGFSVKTLTLQKESVP